MHVAQFGLNQLSILPNQIPTIYRHLIEVRIRRRQVSAQAPAIVAHDLECRFAFWYATGRSLQDVDAVKLSGSSAQSIS